MIFSVRADLALVRRIARPVYVLTVAEPAVATVKRLAPAPRSMTGISYNYLCLYFIPPNTQKYTQK
jgi:hypothetical protein